MPSQWETALLRNDVSHWLGASLESALRIYLSLNYEDTIWIWITITHHDIIEILPHGGYWPVHHTYSVTLQIYTWWRKEPGPWFNIKMTSYQDRKSHCGDKTILRPSYLHNGTSYTGKMTSLYWIRAQGTRNHTWKYLCLRDINRRIIILKYVHGAILFRTRLR